MTEPTSPNDHALQRTRPNWVSPARAAFCRVAKHFDPKEQLIGAFQLPLPRAGGGLALNQQRRVGDRFPPYL